MKKIILIFILFLVIIVLFTQKSNVLSVVIDNDYPKTMTVVHELEGIIEIPKIGLKREFKNTNNVDKGITVIAPSQSPSIADSLLILAGHSGTGLQSYFNYLYKLKINDKVYIIQNNHKYVYKIIDIYKRTKTGKAKIYKIKDKTTLVLVTCTNNDNRTQTFYTAVLID